MLSCKRRCRKCFPNGCCGFCKPLPQIQKQVDTIIHLEKAVEKKETRYGYIHIYPGVRTSDNTYTCPMLSVHLYRHSQHKADIAQDNRTITFDNNNRQQTHQGPRQLKRGETAKAEEELIMIPLEDVTLISSKAEIKTGIQADIKFEIVPVYEPSENCCDRCCDSILSCCRKTRDCCCYCCQNQTKVAPLVRNTTTLLIGEDPNRNTNYTEEDLPLPKENEGCCDRFRCWCCRKQKLIRLFKKTNTAAEKQAERVITMTIDYSKYSNLDSASNARLLSNDEQVAYYKKKFQPDTPLEFYLVHNTEFDKTNFEMKKKEAETLCRTIMQLKGMRNRYPSDNELEKILDQSHIRTFGDIFIEPLLQLPFNSTTNDPRTPHLPQPPQRRPIEDKRSTTISDDYQQLESKVIEQD